MSNVLKRFRKETELQFMMNAVDLQIELTKFVMSDKNVPKKYRLVVGVSIVQKVDELVDNLNFANCIFPQTQDDFAKRAEYQRLAMTNVWQLHNKLVRMIECIDTVKVEKMTKIIELLNSEIPLIKAWMKSDKEKMKKLFAVS